MIRVLLFFIFLILFSCKEKTIYDLTFLDLSGKAVRISSKGKKLLLYVWSGTCIGHTEDLKVLNSEYEKLTKDYHVVSVAVFMTPEGVKEFVQKVKIKPRFPILADPKGNLTEIERLIFLPATLIFTPEGKLLNNYPRFPLQRLISFVESDDLGFCYYKSLDSFFNFASWHTCRESEI